MNKPKQNVLFSTRKNAFKQTIPEGGFLGLGWSFPLLSVILSFLGSSNSTPSARSATAAKPRTQSRTVIPIAPTPRPAATKPGVVSGSIREPTKDAQPIYLAGTPGDRAEYGEQTGAMRYKNSETIKWLDFENKPRELKIDRIVSEYR